MSSKLYPRYKRGSTCCVPGCSCTSGTNLLSEVKMFTFPKDVKRRKQWTSAIGREGWFPSTGSRICSNHFVSKHPSSDSTDPDWIPSVFHFSSTHKSKMDSQVKFDIFTGNHIADKLQSMKSSAVYPVVESNEQKFQNSSVSTQTDLTLCQLSAMETNNNILQKSNDELREIVLGLRIDNIKLQKMLQTAIT